MLRSAWISVEAKLGRAWAEASGAREATEVRSTTLVRFRARRAMVRFIRASVVDGCSTMLWMKILTPNRMRTAAATAVLVFLLRGNAQTDWPSTGHDNQ